MKFIIRITAVLLLITPQAHAVDQGYFACLGLDESTRRWFASVDNCCDIGDGMPTRAEDRTDGVYVPPFSETKALADLCRAGTEIPVEPRGADHSHWVRLPEGADRKRNNPVGIAVIWWTNSNAIGATFEHSIRCFVNTLRG